MPQLPPVADSRARDAANALRLLELAHTGRVLFGSDAPTVGLRRAKLAQEASRWVHQCVASVMGGLNIEDAAYEMDKVASEVQRMVFGGAALALEDDIILETPEVVNNKASLW